MWRSPKRRPNSDGGRQESLRQPVATQDAELTDLVSPNQAFGNKPLETSVPVPAAVQEREDYKVHVNTLLNQHAHRKMHREKDQVVLELLRATNVQTVESLKEDGWMYDSMPPL